jgi:hypothetical protein
MVKSYMLKVQDIAEKLAAGPTLVKDMHHGLEENESWLKWSPLLPTALISILCLGMVVEAFAVEFCDSSTVAFEVDRSLRVATFLFAFVIVVVTVVGAAELFTGNLVSLLCMHVDDHVLQAVQFGAGEGALHNASRHYISGKGFNPLMEMLESADRQIFQISAEYNTVKSLLEFLGTVSMCPVTHFIPIREVAANAQELLSAVRPLLSNSHIYPYYDEVVRRGTCGSFVDSLGWILLAQVAVGLLCFPLCVYFTHKFLTQWALWEWAKEHAVDTGLGLPSSRSSSGRRSAAGTSFWTRMLPMSARSERSLSSRTVSRTSMVESAADDGSEGEARLLCIGCMQ